MVFPLQVPAYVRKARQVQVVIEKKKLRVLHQSDCGKWLTLVQGPLTWEINREESMWESGTWATCTGKLAYSALKYGLQGHLKALVTKVLNLGSCMESSDLHNQFRHLTFEMWGRHCLEAACMVQFE